MSNLSENKTFPQVMRRSKSLTTAVLALWVVFSLFYYNILNLLPQFKLSVLENRPFYKVYKDHFNETGDFLLNTTGCVIPNYMRRMNFKKPARSIYSNCGKRGIFVNALSDDEIVFEIRDDILSKYRKDKNPYKCCYEFVSRPKSSTPGTNDRKVELSKCEPFQNGTTTKLIQEIISVKCSSNKSKSTFYEDSYILMKKIRKKETKELAEMWNVLILGMDTMSRARARHTMPLTMQYFKESGWLDYKAYQKVGENTYPNLMAMLSGDAKLYCKSSMDTCNDRLIWSEYSKSGYVTAYGEDFLYLPDTFRNYGGFEIPPTDHYMRPLFLLGEKNKGNIVCSRRKPSAVHMLDYATQLAKKYKNGSFFGLFWINSYSHNQINDPELFDEYVSTFLRSLHKSKTFIFFMSDHGIRFGETRFSVESFYEERLPMLYIWVPHKFREQHPTEFYNLQVNQNRLTITYDLHETLWGILKKSDNTVNVKKSTVCPQCTSLFDEKSLNRTCTEAVIDEKWCTCRKLAPVVKNTTAAQNIVATALSALRNFSSTIKTKKCTRCKQMSVKTVLRIHSYYNEEHNKTHYLLAFLATPGHVAYEVIVDEEVAGYNVSTPFSTITAYNTKGVCVINKAHQGYCICEDIPKCQTYQKNKINR